MSTGIRPATAREPMPQRATSGASSLPNSARPRTAMTPAEYLQQHKIRDKLYALTRSLAIHQPHNPDVFLSASQRLVERDAVLRNPEGNRRLLHERLTEGGSAANAGASGAAGHGMNSMSLLLELEHNTKSLEGLSSAIVPHVDNGFAGFDADGQTALVGSLRVFLLANAAAEEQAQKALLKLVNAGVPTSRQGYLQTLPEAFPRPALSGEEAKKKLGALRRDITVLVKALAADFNEKAPGPEARRAASAAKLDELQAQISRDFDALSTDLATPGKMSWLALEWTQMCLEYQQHTKVPWVNYEDKEEEHYVPVNYEDAKEH